MERRGFLGALAALLVVPKAAKAATFNKLSHETLLTTRVPEGTPMMVSPPAPTERLVYYIQQANVPNQEIPTIDLALKSAPASTICTHCFRRYDKHAWTGPAERRVSLRDICDVKHTLWERNASAERARKMNAGEEY